MQSQEISKISSQQQMKEAQKQGKFPHIKPFILEIIDKERNERLKMNEKFKFI